MGARTLSTVRVRFSAVVLCLPVCVCVCIIPLHSVCLCSPFSRSLLPMPSQLPIIGGTNNVRISSLPFRPQVSLKQRQQQQKQQQKRTSGVTSATSGRGPAAVVFGLFSRKTSKPVMGSTVTTTTTTSGIKLTQNVDDQFLDELGVKEWPVWSCEESTFPWQYSEQESCLILEGDVVVTPDGGEPVAIQAGDFVTFPEGMSCTWDVKKPVKKRYYFGQF